MEYPKSSRFKDLTQPPREGGARHKLLQELHDGCHIGIHLDHGKTMAFGLDSDGFYKKTEPGVRTEVRANVSGVLHKRSVDQKRFGKQFMDVMLTASSEQNYAVWAPYGRFGPAVFIHGRELFRSAETFRRYQQHDYTAADAASLFNESALDKIRSALLPQLAGLHKYGMQLSQDEKDMAEQLLTAFKKHFPKGDYSQLAYREGEYFGFENQVLKAASQAGCSPEEINGIKAGSHHSLKKEQSDGLFFRSVHQSLPEERLRHIAHHLKPAVMAYARQYRNDPEIYYNFCSGLRLSNGREMDVAKLLEAGQWQRALDVALEIAGQISNPFDARFLEKERQMGTILTRSVHPRILRHTLCQHLPFIFTDSESIYAAERYRPPTANAMGSYNHYSGRPPFTGMIIVSAPHLNRNRLAWLLRHEAHHGFDFTNRRPFHTHYGQELIDATKEDYINVMTARSTCTFEPMFKDYIIKLGELLGEQPAPPVSERQIKKLRTHVLAQLDQVRRRIEYFAPLDLPMASLMGTTSAYTSNLTQVNEIPAIMGEMRGRFGDAFIKEMMPKTYALVRKHDLSHPGLRDDPSASPAR